MNIQNVVTPRENSAFYQTIPSDNTSDKYKLLSTADVTAFFQEKGFFISGYAQAGTIKPEYHGKSKHIVRLRPCPVTFPELYQTSDIPEIVIFNSHNKYTSLKINIGIYRIICLNGMILGDEFFSERIIHSGNSVDEQLETLLNDALIKFKEVSNIVDRLKDVKVTRDMQESMVKFGLSLRDKGTNKEVTQWDINRNLDPKRQGDTGNDVYTLMNIIQEKVIRGGFVYTLTDKDNNKTIKKFGETKNITNIEKLNKQLFDYTLKMVA